MRDTPTIPSFLGRNYRSSCRMKLDTWNSRDFKRWFLYDVVDTDHDWDHFPWLWNLRSISEMSIEEAAKKKNWCRSCNMKSMLIRLVFVIPMVTAQGNDGFFSECRDFRLIALESAYWYILAARNLFKDFGGEKNQDFMIIRCPISWFVYQWHHFTTS